MGRKIEITALPDDALLQVYAKRPECYTDCFSDLVSRDVSLPEFITAFYSTKLFALERMILKWTVKRPSTSQDIADLAADETTTFAAWSVEAREADQLLLRDMQNRTRSWLMVQPEPNGTRVYFGSAVTPPEDRSELGVVFKSFLGLHKIYSRALLRSALKLL